MNHLTHSLAGLLGGVFTKSSVDHILVITFSGNSMDASLNKGMTAGFNTTYILAYHLELMVSVGDATAGQRKLHKSRFNL